MLGPFTSYDALKPGDAHLEGKRSRHRGAPARDCWAAELVLKPPVSVSPCGLSRVRGWAEIILHDVPQDWSWCRRRDAPAFQTLRPRVVLVAARPTRLAGKAEAVPGSPILSPAGLVGGPGGGGWRWSGQWWGPQNDRFVQLPQVRKPRPRLSWGPTGIHHHSPSVHGDCTLRTGKAGNKLEKSQEAIEKSGQDDADER